jgi:hypothetical protein
MAGELSALLGFSLRTVLYSYTRLSGGDRYSEDFNAEGLHVSGEAPAGGPTSFSIWVSAVVSLPGHNAACFSRWLV